MSRDRSGRPRGVPRLNLGGLPTDETPAPTAAPARGSPGRSARRSGRRKSSRRAGSAAGTAPHAHGVVGRDVGERLVSELEEAIGQLGPGEVIKLLERANVATSRGERGGGGRATGRASARHGGGGRAAAAARPARPSHQPRGDTRRGRRSVAWADGESDSASAAGSLTSGSGTESSSEGASSGSDRGSRGGRGRQGERHRPRARGGADSRQAVKPASAGVGGGGAEGRRRLERGEALADRARRANPTGDAVVDMALWLGLDPAGEADQAAMWVAEEALAAPLPQGWATATVPLPAAPATARRGAAARSGGAPPAGVEYFFRSDDGGRPVPGTSQWAHPLDGYYRALARRAREELGGASASAVAPAAAGTMPPAHPSRPVRFAQPAQPLIIPPADRGRGNDVPPALIEAGGEARGGPPPLASTARPPPDYDPRALDRAMEAAVLDGRARRPGLLSRLASTAAAAVASFVAPPAQAPRTPPRSRAYVPRPHGSPSRVAPIDLSLVADDSPTRARAAVRGTVHNPSGLATRIRVAEATARPGHGTTPLIVTLPQGSARGLRRPTASERLGLAAASALLVMPRVTDPLLGGTHAPLSAVSRDDVSRAAAARGLDFRCDAPASAGPETPPAAPRPSWRIAASLAGRRSGLQTPVRRAGPPPRSRSVGASARAQRRLVRARPFIAPSALLAPATDPLMPEEVGMLCQHVGVEPGALARSGALWLARAAVVALPPPAWAVVPDDDAACGGALFAHRRSSAVIAWHPVDAVLLPLMRAAALVGGAGAEAAWMPVSGVAAAATALRRAEDGVSGTLWEPARSLASFALVRASGAPWETAVLPRRADEPAEAGLRGEPAPTDGAIGIAAGSMATRKPAEPEPGSSARASLGAAAPGGSPPGTPPLPASDMASEDGGLTPPGTPPAEEPHTIGGLMRPEGEPPADSPGPLVGGQPATLGRPPPPGDRPPPPRGPPPPRAESPPADAGHAEPRSQPPSAPPRASADGGSSGPGPHVDEPACAVSVAEHGAAGPSGLGAGAKPDRIVLLSDRPLPEHGEAEQASRWNVDEWLEGACGAMGAEACREAVLRRYAIAVGIRDQPDGLARPAPDAQLGPPAPLPPGSGRPGAADPAPPRPPPASARSSAPPGEVWQMDALRLLSLPDGRALQRVLATLVQWQSEALIRATARRDEAAETAQALAARARSVLARNGHHPA